MTTVPVPRYDLLKSKDYLFGSVQFSRGCPFQCEFCDIIVTFGRRPRLKTSAQVIAELEAMRKQHLKVAFIVDDNLIGNKAAVKELLREVAAWQAAEGYPMTFFTEASLNLAEDEELMQLMDAANIVTVFIGIESPNEESLRETKKYQNVKKAGSIVDRVRKVQDSFEERGPTRSRRRTTVRHQRHSARHDARRAARRVRRPDARAVRSRLLLRAARKSVPHKAIRFCLNPKCLLAQTSVAEVEVTIGRCRARDRPVPTADEKRSRPGIAPDLSPPDGHHGPPTARSEPVVHLRDQVRDALPPLHNVPPDGRAAHAGEHLLEASTPISTTASAFA